MSVALAWVTMLAPRKSLVPTLLLSLLASAGCTEAPDDGELLEVQCGGKCDGFDYIRSYWADAMRVDLGDLMAVGSGIAADGLSMNIADFASIGVGEPVAYALSDRAFDDHTVEDIDALVDGLAARFGESDLTTQVNQIRRRHLRNTDDNYYGEAAFSVGLDIDPRWNWDLEVGGLDDVYVNVGFQIGDTIEARVINAFKDEKDAYFSNPIKAAKELRGFVFPKNSDDVLDMKPGESFALNGEGVLGVNLGVGVPFLIADPGKLSYEIVFSAALRTRLEGDMDVQLVRLEDNQVVVDVGMERLREYSGRVGVSDSWGVAGLVKSKVNVGPIKLDLGKLVEKTLKKKLNKYLTFLDGRLEHTNLKSRVSVARFRFDLEPGNVEGEVASAMAQALKGDVRLAQALANRGTPGVIAEFDLVRSGITTTSYAGIDLFGMSFFKEVTETESTAVVQTPGGIASYLFETLHKASGWFFSTHRTLRTGVAGLFYSPSDSRQSWGETNLFVQTLEGDGFMEREKMVDHYDGLIVAVAGLDALKAFETYGNEIETYVADNCKPDNAWAECREEILDDPYVTERVDGGMRALQEAVNGKSEPVRQLVTFLGRERLRAQSVREYGALWTGPSTSIVTNYRLDDESLAQIAENATGYDFRNAVQNYLRAVEVDRQSGAGDIADDRRGMGREANLEELREIFDNRMAEYRTYLGAEDAVIPGLGRVGSKAVEMSFEIDNDNRPLYEEAVADSIAHRRMRVINRLFDKVADKAETHRGEHVAAYALLSMIPEDHLDVRVDVDMLTENSSGHVNDAYRAAGYFPFDVYIKGSAAKAMDYGMFTVEGLSTIEDND